MLITACGVPEDRFRLEGRFKNLNQGEFFLYNLQKGTIDTLHVNDGRFVYDISLRDTMTLSLLFPNFYELPIFACPGNSVKVEGDVSHLRETEIKGTEENETMTAFRLATNELMPPEVQEKALQFINEHSESAVSVYLLHRYFIMNVEDDYPQVYKLCTLLLNNQPSNLSLIQLHQRLERVKNLKQKGKLPSFRTVATSGRTVTNDNLDGKVNVILTWASWNYDSQNILRQLRTLQKQHPKDLKVLSICLDASPSEGRQTLERDSITWPNVCDGKLWNSPVLTQLGLTFVPDNIVVGKDGEIVARGLSSTELREKVEKSL